MRRAKLVDQLEGAEVVGLGAKYGIAEADEIVQFTRIGADGNALMTRTYTNLVPRGGDTLDSLPVLTLSTKGFVGIAPPKIKILDDSNNYYANPTWQVVESDDAESVGRSIGRISFSPPLRKTKPLSLEVSYLLCNAFQFVEEYRRTVSRPPESMEHNQSSFRAVYPRLATDIIVFPPRLGPKQRPLVHVSRGADPTDPDEAETEFCNASGISVVYDPGIISLSVRAPLPDFNYRVSWHLRSESEFNGILYTDPGVQAYYDLTQARLLNQASEDALVDALRLVRTGLPELIDGETGISLHVAVVERVGWGAQLSIKTELRRFARLNSAAGNQSSGYSFVPGVGVAGQVFRGGQPILFKNQGRAGGEFYVKVPDQRDVHAALYCVPLPVLPGGINDIPTYGVVSISTYSERSRLCSLNTTTTRPVLLSLTDIIQGKINKQIQAVLR